MSNFPPYVRGSETSYDAAVSIQPSATNLRDMIFDLIEDRGGLTCDEVEEITELKHQTASARIKELKDRGRLEPQGKRPTRSGRMADVLVVSMMSEPTLNEHEKGYWD